MISVRNAQKIGRSAKKYSIKSDSDRSGKCNAFEKYFFCISATVVIRVLKNKYATITSIGKTMTTGFVIFIFGYPYTSAIIPAESHRLCHHWFRRPYIGLK